MKNAYKSLSYYYDEMMEEINYDYWLNFLLPYLKENDKILDLACGTGTLLCLLGNYGYQVSGLDLSSEAIYIADKKRAMNHLTIDFQVSDMTDFHYEEKFNVISCFFDSINFLKENEIKKMFDCVYENLEENGYFIFDVFGKEKLSECDGDLIEDEIGLATYTWKSKVQDETIYHDLTINDGDLTINEKYFEIYYDYHKLLDERFKVIKIVSDFEDELNEDGERILVVLQKK